MKNRFASIVDKINPAIYVAASIIVPFVLMLFSLVLSPTLNPLMTAHIVTDTLFIIFIAHGLVAPPLVIILKLHDKERRVFIRWLITSAFALVMLGLYSRSLLRLIGLPIPWGHGWEYVAFYVLTVPTAVPLLITVAYRAISKANGKISSFIVSVLSMYLMGFSFLFIFQGINDMVNNMANR